MLTVINGEQAEAISFYKAYEMYEEVNGALTLRLTSFNVPENPGHPLLETEGIIETADQRQFRIKRLQSSANRKQVDCISTFFDLKGVYRYDLFGGSKTLDEFLTWVLDGSGWTFENVDVTGNRLIENYGKADALKLIETLLAEFNCERQIMPGNHLVFKQQIGSDNDEQYRYGHNIRTLSHTVDTTNYGTVIRGYGANGLVVTYRSPQADIRGEIHAEPFSDERFTIAENLIERIKEELRDEPEVSIELDTVEFSPKDLGERVWLIYEPLNIEFQTRVLSKTTREPIENSSVVIGNAQPANIEDALVEQDIKIDENQKQTQSKIEQTNEHINLQVERLDGDIVEAYSQINITADAIRSEVGALQTGLEGQISNNTSLINQTATEIRSEVSSEVTYLDGRIDSANTSISQLSTSISLKADSTTVSSLGTRVTNAEIKVDGYAGQISSKVSTTDYTGAIIASKINQSASIVEISAEAIDLNGIVRVNDSIELGYTGNGKVKAIKFDGNSAWIYSAGQFVLTLDASTVEVEGSLNAVSPAFGTGMPVITGTSVNQRVSIGLTAAGRLRVYTAGGVGYEYNPTAYL